MSDHNAGPAAAARRLVRGLWSCLLLASLACGGQEQPLEPPPDFARVAVNTCEACILGPRVFTREMGPPVTEVFTVAGDSSADYLLVLEEIGEHGVTATVLLDGKAISLPNQSPRRRATSIRRAISLKEASTLSIRLTGAPGSRLSVSLLAGTKQVTKEGGTIRAPGGVATLTIPEGALSEPLDVSVIPLNFALSIGAARSLASPVFSLLPDGTRFLKPVSLSIRVPPGPSPQSGVQLFQYFPASATFSLHLGSEFDARVGELRASLSHFSEYAAIWSTFGSRPGPYSYHLANFPQTTAKGTTTGEVLADVELGIGLWLGYLRTAGVDFALTTSSCADVVLSWRVTEFNAEISQELLLNTECPDKLQRVISLNDAQSWIATERGPAATGELNIADVVAHEFGHALGLDHPSAIKCTQFLVDGILPIDGNIADCYQPPVMRAKGDRAPVPVLLADEDLDNLQQVYGRSGWRESGAWRLEIVDGDRQSALLPNSSVTVRPRVRVTDQAGKPVPGAIVLFTPSEGGIVSGRATATNASGEATVGRWVLGSNPGTHHLAADINLGGWPNSPSQASYTRTHVEFSAAVDDPASGSAMAHLSGGFFSTCGLDRTGVAYCWGANDGGQLGDGTMIDRNSPVAVSTSARFVAIAAAEGHTCALTGAGEVYCWGYRSYGAIGDGSTAQLPIPRSALVPTRLSTDIRFVSIVASFFHTCALSADGVAYCWGLNAEGSLGDGTRLNRGVPTAVETPIRFSKLVTGYNHTCGLAGGAVYCWGFNQNGELGVSGVSAGELRPRLVNSDQQFVALTAKGSHTCALTATGVSYCWGYDAWGQLGSGSTGQTFNSRPTAVASDLRFERIEAGDTHTCALTGSGEMYCWGLNVFGGDGPDGGIRDRPTKIATDLRFLAIAPAVYHLCALSVDPNRELYCWGSNEFGQLGSGSFGGLQPTPLRIRW
jgi:alpha-tubulin suppressor-like RCC1 family protein